MKAGPRVSRYFRPGINRALGGVGVVLCLVVVTWMIACVQETRRSREELVLARTAVFLARNPRLVNGHARLPEVDCLGPGVRWR